ncbi:MAG: hypothetical protein ACTSXP_16480 [Promethearchaeota archaeon]
MGRTVKTYRDELKREIASWTGFKRGLPPDYEKAFDEIMRFARQHADAASLVARPLISEAMFMSALVSLLKKIYQLDARIQELEKSKDLKNDNQEKEIKRHANTDCKPDPNDG